MCLNEVRSSEVSNKDRAGGIVRFHILEKKKVR